MKALNTMYHVKDIFYTLQGEGAQAGRAAVFCRFAGCNGWSGRPQDRSKGPFPCSRWCDTEFVGGRKILEEDLVEEILSLYQSEAYRLLVLTGGEPALQITNSLLRRLCKHIALVAIETNGSLVLPEEAFLKCWITVSPKTETVLQTKCSELKLIYPTIPPETFDYISAPWRFLQPLDTGVLDKEKNTHAAIKYIKEHPHWRLSLQTHKYAGIP